MNEKKYLKWYQKVAYGSGDMAGNCGYALISSFVMLYLTNAVGLNSAIIGTLMMVSKLLDGVSDIFFGGLMDKTKSKMGQARPWMLFGQIGVSASLFLVFSIPSMSQQFFICFIWIRDVVQSFLVCYFNWEDLKIRHNSFTISFNSCISSGYRSPVVFTFLAIWLIFTPILCISSYCFFNGVVSVLTI